MDKQALFMIGICVVWPLAVLCLCWIWCKVFKP